MVQQSAVISHLSSINLQWAFVTLFSFRLVDSSFDEQSQAVIQPYGDYVSETINGILKRNDCRNRYIVGGHSTKNMENGSATMFQFDIIAHDELNGEWKRAAYWQSLYHFTIYVYIINNASTSAINQWISA